MEFRIYDKHHNHKKTKFIYSSHPHFEGKLSKFFKWIEQHQKDYKGLEILNKKQNIN